MYHTVGKVIGYSYLQCTDIVLYFGAIHVVWEVGPRIGIPLYKDLIMKFCNSLNDAKRYQAVAQSHRVNFYN